MGTLSIGLGTLCEPISTQIKSQGLEINEKEASKFDKMKDAYNLLSFHLFTDGESRKLGQRFFNKILKEVDKN